LDDAAGFEPGNRALGATIYVVAYFANQARWLKGGLAISRRQSRRPIIDPCIAVRRVELALGGIEVFWVAISVYGLTKRA